MSRPLPASAPAADFGPAACHADRPSAAEPTPTDGLDASVLEATYCTEAPGLVRYFKRRTRNAEEACDLMQEAFARLAAHMTTTVLSHPASYLQRIARNLLVDRVRAAKRTEAAIGSSFCEQAGIDVAPEQGLAIEGRDVMRLYRQAVDALPERTRKVFLMHRVDELTYREIGERLGIAIPTVQYHFGRALAHIAQALDN